MCVFEDGGDWDSLGLAGVVVCGWNQVGEADAEQQ